MKTNDVLTQWLKFINRWSLHSRQCGYIKAFLNVYKRGGMVLVSAIINDIDGWMFELNAAFLNSFFPLASISRRCAFGRPQPRLSSTGTLGSFITSTKICWEVSWKHIFKRKALTKFQKDLQPNSDYSGVKTTFHED